MKKDKKLTKRQQQKLEEKQTKKQALQQIKALKKEYKQKVWEHNILVDSGINRLKKQIQENNKQEIENKIKLAKEHKQEYNHEERRKFYLEERRIKRENNLKDRVHDRSKREYQKTSPTTDSTGKEILLEVKDVSVHFKIGRKIIRACNHLNFKVYKGETFGLVGESGSGKTTISRAIIGINKVTGGNIFFKGKNISHLKDKKEIKNTKKRIQMIFQDPAASLNERANVDYIISEGLYNFGLYRNKKDRLEKVVDMIESVGLLPEHLTRYPHEFSGGQRQRIGIARALVIEPELVLADEPISALDVSIRAQVLNLLSKLQEEKQLTYLFIAHDLSIIKYISDRIGVMHQGYLVEMGNADEIYSNPIHPYTRALLTAIPQPDPISKDKRKRIPYDMTGIDYRHSEWIEIKPHHFVLGKPEQAKEWLRKANEKNKS